MENDIPDNAIKDGETNSSLDVIENNISDNAIKVGETDSCSLDSGKKSILDGKKEGSLEVASKDSCADKKECNEKDLGTKIVRNEVNDNEQKVNSDDTNVKDDEKRISDDDHEDVQNKVSDVLLKECEKDNSSVVENENIVLRVKDSENGTSLKAKSSEKESIVAKDSVKGSKIVENSEQNSNLIESEKTITETKKDASLAISEKSISNDVHNDNETETSVVASDKSKSNIAHNNEKNKNDDAQKDGKTNSNNLEESENKIQEDKLKSDDDVNSNEAETEKDCKEKEQQCETEASTKSQSGTSDKTCENIFFSINEECKKISGEKEKKQHQVSGIAVDTKETSTENTSSSKEDVLDENNDEPSPSPSSNEIEIVTYTGNSNLFASGSPEVNALESNDCEYAPDKSKVNDDVIDISSPKKVSNSADKNSLPELPNDDDEIEEIQQRDPMDVDEEESASKANKVSSNSPIDSPQNKGESTEKESELKENGNNGPGKIKLRSFAFLCESESEKKDASDKSQASGISNSLSSNLMTNIFSSEISGVTVGDIVQHSNIVESDECGIIHLKISNVVGGEDCITGLTTDEERDALLPIQVSSIASLIEPISPGGTSGEKTDAGTSMYTPEEETGNTANLQSWEMEGTSIKSASDSNAANADMSSKQQISTNLEPSQDEGKETQTIVNVFRSPLIVSNNCMLCKKKSKCEFRLVFKQKSETKVSFICSNKCKSNAISSLPEDHVVQKPRLYFERICGMCGKEVCGLPKSKIYSWQTREFCNKLCLADHIGEVARSCYCCKSPVRVLYMVKYCVRFGSDVHQFCSNSCLETYKSKIKVCSFCQKNLDSVMKVVSPSNKEYCSNKCLKRAQRRDISQQHYKEENDCTVCQKKMINKYEFIHNGAPTWLCSDPCLNVFKYVNQVRSVNCCLCARLLNAEDSCNYFFNGKQLRVFCSESCFSVFVISARKIVTCQYCKVKKYNFDMICSNTDDLGEIFSCSVCCLNFIENPSKSISAPEKTAVDSDTRSTNASDVSLLKGNASSTVVKSTTDPSSVTPILKECSMCSKTEPAQFHMVMSDSTLRSFCSYVCATRYKCTFGYQVSGGFQPLSTSNNSEDVKVATAPQSKNNKNEGRESNRVGKKIKMLPKKLDEKDLLALMQLLNPPAMCNKATMCRPILNTKGVQCKPHQWHKECQTDEDMKPSAIIPVPIPVYVPTPFMMFSAPTPVPLFVPIPVPIPVFIPTFEKNIKDLENRIQTVLDELPSDPVESDLLLLAQEEEMKRKREENEILLKKMEKARAAERKSAAIISEKPNEDEVISQKGKGSRIKGDDQKDEADMETGENNIETATEIITRLEATLPKKTVPGENSDESKQEEEQLDAGNKRKLGEAEEIPLTKKKKVDDDEEVDGGEGVKEHLNFSLGVSVWQAWVKRRKMLDEDSTSSNDDALDEIINMNCEVLSNNLILFLYDLGSHDTQYDADTIYYILLGLQKYLFEQGSTHCIFLELNFENFTTVFDDMIRKFFESTSKSDVNPDCKYLTGTRVTEEMLWEARQLGAHTPHVLINTLFYFNTKVFKLKSPEEHNNLTFKQILKQWNRASLGSDVSLTMTTLLKYFPKQLNKTDDKSSEVCLEMYENKENPLRCPVKLYEFYLSKCPESIRTQSNTYYVYPEQSCLPDSPVWFSTTSFEMKTTEKMLNRVLLVREVQDALFG